MACINLTSFLKKNNAYSLQALLLRSPLMASSYPAEIKEDPLPLSQLHRVKEDEMPLNPPRFQIRFIPMHLKMCSSVLFVWKDFEMRIYVHTVQNYAVTNAFEGRGLQYPKQIGSGSYTNLLLFDTFFGEERFSWVPSKNKVANEKKFENLNIVI